MSHNHAVWPTGVPPVCTAFWTTESWQKFEDRFRPAGYTGGRHDQAAWDAYTKGVQEQVAEGLRLQTHQSLSRTLGQEAADQWLTANREANR
jgi:hypothetical protein